MGRALDKYLISKKAKESAALSAPVERKKWTEVEIKEVLDRAGHHYDWENPYFDGKLTKEQEEVLRASEAVPVLSDKPVEVSDEVGSW